MRIAIIGAGNMGGAIARGIAGAIAAGQSHHTLVVSNPSEGKLNALKSAFPFIETYTDNAGAIEGVDLVILAVKPWLVEQVLKEAGALLGKETILVSVAAGITLDSLENMAGEKHRAVYRAMPNTAAAVGRSMTFVAGKNTTPESDEAVKAIFENVGTVMMIEERLMAAGTSLSGCGIAYIFRFIRAMQEGGVQLGFYTKDALNIVAQTMEGALKLLETNGSHPEQEIDKVTTPGGLTIKGLNTMEQAGFTNAVIQGLTRNS